MNVTRIADKKRPDYLMRRLKAVEDAVARLRTARSLNAAKVNSGGLTIAAGGSLNVVAANGQTILAIARVTGADRPDGTPQTGIVMARDTGETALALIDTITTDGYQQALQWFDRAGHVVVSDDTNGGVGLATPYLPLANPVDVISFPLSNTTAAAWTELARGVCYRHHPKFYAQILAATDAGTTANVRIRYTASTVIGTAKSVGAGTTALLGWGPTALPAPATMPEFQNISIEAQVTGGTGRVGVRSLGIWGTQS